MNEIEKQLYDYIDSDTVKEIFRDLLSYSKSIEKFTCEARNYHKGKKDFKYYHNDNIGKYVFAFIVNKKDLLFYIRRPAMTINPLLRKFLKGSVLKFSKNPVGEFTARVETREQLEKIKEILEYY